jgi:hypothetical protein
MTKKTKECAGSPPDRSITWTVTLRKDFTKREKLSPGGTYRAHGQTAYVAAASLGLMLSEVDTITPETL